MKKIFLTFACATSLLSSCQKIDKKNFGQDGLQTKVFTIKGNEISIKEVLSSVKGKTTFIDLWASWCGDCGAGLPEVQALQTQYGNALNYIFISLDRNEVSWKKSIKAYQLKGIHYWLKNLKNWKKPHSFTQDIDLDWIPRYIIVGKDGSIKYFRAIHANDPKLIQAIENELKP